MAKIVLIHGYGISITSPWQQSHGEDAGFIAFGSMVTTGQAKAFRWARNYHYNLSKACWPTSYIRPYLEERALIYQPELWQKLDSFLKQEQPQIMVCHSMGAQLWLNYLANFQPPATIGSVWFLQADINWRAPIPQSGSELEWNNCYCHWDQALVASSLMKLSPRAGLVGWRQNQVENYFTPLWGHLNLHTASQRDQNLVSKIMHKQ